MKKNKKNVIVERRIALLRERARVAHKEWKRNRRRLEQGADKFRRATLNARAKDSRAHWITAPRIFELNNNTDTVVDFIGLLESSYIRGDRVYVNLVDVESIDYGAVLALLSIMMQFRKKGIKFDGNYPRDALASKKLTESGFFKNLYANNHDNERFCISNSADNSVVTHAWSKVDTILSSEIIKESSQTIWGKQLRCQGVQRVIGELMLNTNNHAAIGAKGARNWWLYVNHDSALKKVSFAFVDFGVGIFESLKNKPADNKWYGWLDKVTQRIKHGSNSDVLKLIMEGDFHKTVTGKYYRGKGLPGIAEVERRGQISNLIIISNDAAGWVSQDSYRLLKSKFSGTYIYWELGVSNGHCK